MGLSPATKHDADLMSRLDAVAVKNHVELGRADGLWSVSISARWDGSPTTTTHADLLEAVAAAINAFEAAQAPSAPGPAPR